MANDTNKIKLLVLWDILCKNTDENHAMNSDEIREELAKRGISVMRKVVATDIAALNKYGYEVLSYKKKYYYYYVVSRPLETAEVVMLADVIKASKLTSTQKNIMIEKLSGTLCSHQAENLSKHIISLDKSRKGSSSLIYNVDAIERGIEENKQISFLYFDYDEKHKKVYRKNGDRYMVNPAFMVWNRDNYYMQKHSRHIYDIYQLLGRVELNEEFRALIHRVREDRKYHSLCVSAQNNADIPALLEQVIETECYKKDYEEHTRTMLYTPCNYEEAITGLKKIIDSGMFGKDEEYEKNTVHISVSSASKIASYKEYRIFAMPEHDKYGDYAYKIPNKFISINRSEKAIVFHLPKDYVVRLKNGRTNQTAELTVTEFVAEVAGKDESAYGMKIIRPSQTANGGNTPKKKKTDFNSK